MTETTISISYPFDDVRAGGSVLAAALALFAPEDGVALQLHAPSGTPGDAQIAELRNLIAELSLPFGQVPRLRITDAATAAAAPALLRIDVTGEPHQDALAILALGSVGRQLGAAYGVSGSPWLRGGAELLRGDLDAVFARRQRHPRRDRSVVKIAVLLQRVQVWGAVAPIVRAGLDHPDVELDVVLLDDLGGAFTSHDRAEFAALCATQGIELRDEDWLRLRRDALDVAVVPDPYITEASTSQGLSLRELADTGIRLVLSPYAQALSGEVRGIALLHNLPFHNLAWRVFAPSEASRGIYAEVCAAGDAHVRYLGSPKREQLLVDETARQGAAALRRRLKTHTVTLWNPHFNGGDGTSTFETMLEPILSYFQSHPTGGLILRPHPRLFADYERMGQGETVENLRALIARMSNVVLDESMDAAAAMLAADAMISDLSSLIAEYHVLGRPVGLLRPEGGLELNEDRGWLAGATTIDNAAEVTRFLSGVRPAPSAQPGAQEDVGAGARILEAVVQDFRLEQAGVLGVA